ncbi:MAG: putative transporter [Bacteroidales bacterium]|jgi:putative transport protein|nr:putative transporter [Bacteroidales bacterium]
MEWLFKLLFEEGVAHSILLLSLCIGLGHYLGKLKIANISLGITWILFVGIIFSHFGLTIHHDVLHFVKEFGLILFVYSIGLQVGPGFFASFKSGGVKLNILALSIVLLGVLTTFVIHLISGEDIVTMSGVLAGATTNTPSLGAAQQTYSDTIGGQNTSIALGYAVAYPLGVVGVIIVMLLLKKIFKIDLREEESKIQQHQAPQTLRLNIVVENQCVVGKKLSEVVENFKSTLVVSRVKHSDGMVEIATDDTILQAGDILRLVTTQDNEKAIVMLLGKEHDLPSKEWETPTHDLVSRKVVVTKPELNGKTIGSLNIRALYGVNITRINRSGVELIADRSVTLQIGDRVTLVGSLEKIEKVTEMLGNSLKRLEIPNLIPIFIGVVLGIVLGSIPIAIPGLPQSVKLGLAGGPLIIAILMGKFGPHYKIVTFTTTSANMMIREIGISLFLAAVGLSAGQEFISSIVNGGYMWLLYGLIITVVPTLLVGIFARVKYKMDYFTIIGLLSGSTTNPPALAFANSQSQYSTPSVVYATVYPLTMFLRVLTIQLLLIIGLS